MQTNRFVAAIAIIILTTGVSLSLTTKSATAYHQAGSQEVSFSGLAFEGSDPEFGFVRAGTQGSTIKITGSLIPTAAADVKLGAKFDWAAEWQNTTTTTVGANKRNYLELSVTVPTTAGLELSPHDYQITIFCVTCATGAHDVNLITDDNFAVYTADQASGIAAREEAESKISTLSFTLAGLNELPPGASKAIGDLAEAQAELGLGDTDYQNGNYASAKTHYDRSLQLADSAVRSLSATGGGIESSSLLSILLSGVGILLFGVGVILAGIGAIFYMMRRSKAKTMTA